MDHFGLTQIIDVSNVSIAGYAGWPVYDPFFIVSLSGRPVYDQNPLRPNPNPKKPVSGSCCVRGLGRTLTPLSLPTLMRVLPRGDLGLYFYLYLFSCACIFNSLGICAQILAFFSSDLHGICACIFNSPGGYVHKFCILLFWLACDLCLHIQFLEDMCTSSVFFWLMRKSLMCDLLGKITLLRNVLMAHGKAVLVILTY